MEALSGQGHTAESVFCQIKTICDIKTSFSTLLTWDFVNFVQKFALDLLKHVIPADLCVIGARDVCCGGGDGAFGRSYCHSTDGLGGRRGLRLFEKVELHSQRLGAASLQGAKE